MRSIYEYYRREDEKIELSTSICQDVYELREILNSLLQEAMEAGMMGDYRRIYSIFRSTKDLIDETIEIIETRK